jgi:hypothetical protein
VCQPKLLLGHKKRAHTNRALYSQFQYFSGLIQCIYWWLQVPDGKGSGGGVKVRRGVNEVSLE